MKRMISFNIDNVERWDMQVSNILNQITIYLLQNEPEKFYEFLGSLLGGSLGLLESLYKADPKSARFLKETCLQILKNIK